MYLSRTPTAGVAALSHVLEFTPCLGLLWGGRTQAARIGPSGIRSARSSTAPARSPGGRRSTTPWIAAAAAATTSRARRTGSLQPLPAPLNCAATKRTSSSSSAESDARMAGVRSASAGARRGASKSRCAAVRGRAANEVSPLWEARARSSSARSARNLRERLVDMPLRKRDEQFVLAREVLVERAEDGRGGPIRDWRRARHRSRAGLPSAVSLRGPDRDRRRSPHRPRHR